MNHTYTVEQLESGALRLTCPECGRVVVVYPDRKPVTEKEGEAVPHSWAAPGVVIKADIEEG